MPKSYREVNVFFSGQTPEGFRVSKEWKSISEAIKGLQDLLDL